MDAAARLDAANLLIREIAGCGRQIFAENDRLSRDARGRVWFYDSYSKEHIYTHYAGRWRGFTHGGTLKVLIQYLRRWVVFGTKLPPSILGPWPSEYDPWAYGPDMERVRTCARDLGLLD